MKADPATIKNFSCRAKPACADRPTRVMRNLNPRRLKLFLALTAESVQRA
jgi:hypothetical protein